MQPVSVVEGDELVGSAGVRPTHTPEARTRRQEANRTRRAEQAAWEAEHVRETFDPEWFRANVLPGLAGVSLPAIAKATGMSTSAASKVRAGRRVPHPRHWGALDHLGVPGPTGRA